MNFAQIYFRKKRRQLESISDFRVLFSLLFIVSVCISAVFFLAWSRAQVNDPKISLTPYTQDELDKMPVKIETGLIINNFFKFDLLDNNFIIDATLWFLTDNSENIHQSLDNFAFEDAILLKKSEAQKDILPDGKLLLRYNVQIQCNGVFYFNHYPFDYHRLNIVLINNHVSMDDKMYVTQKDNFIIKPYAYTKNWHVNNTFAEYGKNDLNVTLEGVNKKVTYERVVFGLEFERKSLKEIFLIFLPLFLIFYIGLLSLTFDLMTQFSIILSLCLGSTTALIFFLDLLRKTSPGSDTFTLVDMIYIFLLFIIIITFIVQIIAMNFLYQKQKQTQLQEVLDSTVITLNIIRSLFFIFFLFLMLIIVAWLLLI